MNLSESLGRVPGIVVQNRQNYAQDLQISSRGFGARSTFGVRGIRLIADGIPATMPDGQGQAATFALGSAAPHRGAARPVLGLYGNAAGGVISIETEDGPPVPDGRSRACRRPLRHLEGGPQVRRAVGPARRNRRLNGIADLSRFHTDGYRQHSAATRDHLNGKLRLDARAADSG